MKILHLEDNPNDAELIGARLLGIWPECSIRLAKSRAEFVKALSDGHYEVILSDYRLPDFNGREALTMAKEVTPDTPFIFVSGTVGEEAAVEIVRNGASDYLLKDRLQRLPLAIQRALQECEERRKHQEDADRIREQAELLDQARDGIVVTDLSNTIRFWNLGAERILGWTAAEACGNGKESPRAPELDALIELLNQSEGTSSDWKREVRLRNKAGADLVVDLRVSTIFNEQGSTKAKLKILTDITEKKKIEEQYLRAQRLDCLGMLAAGIAHDLNNALAPVLMVASLLRTRTTDPRDLEVLDILERSAARGASLVKQILSFAGGGNQEHLTVQTKHLLRDILDLAHETFPRSIEVKYDTPGDLWSVSGNPTQLHQVLLNLTINARDAMPEGGMLTIKGENCVLKNFKIPHTNNVASGNFLCLEVSDTGSGIPKELLERIWEPFFTTKGEGKGTGLGLATVRGIVAQHGGFITLDSEQGHGAKFRVFLPALAEQALSDSAKSAHPFAPLGRGELVMVVDDDRSVRESVSAMISFHGFRTIAVGDSIDALSMYAERPREIEVIITDIDMPGLNGRGLATAICRINPKARVIFMSGGGSGQEAPFEALGLKTLFIAKPFSKETLLKALNEML